MNSHIINRTLAEVIKEGLKPVVSVRFESNKNIDHAMVATKIKQIQKTNMTTRAIENEDFTTLPYNELEES